MKIAVISSQVFPAPPQGYAGLEAIAYHCAAGLAGRGHQVALVAPEGSSCPGGEVIAVGPPGRWDEQSAYERYWHRLPEFDCIVDHSWAKWSYCLKAEGKLPQPILSVFHAPVHTMYAVWPPAFPKLPPVEKACPVCISRDQALHFEGLHGREARVCHNGIDPDFYRPLNVPRSDRFLFLGRFSTVKSPHLAIAACREAGLPLDLVGDTSITNEPEYLRQCQAMCDGRQIRTVGPASRGECVHWFSQARGFVHLCPQFREPFGLAPVEAMACGLPVLAFRYGAVRETVKHGETGFLVESFAEAVNVLRSGAMDKLDRNRCREWALQFSVDNMVSRYDELCEEAVRTGGW